MADADSRPATQAELLDVKAELKADIQKLDQRVDKLDQRVDKLDQRVDKLDQKINNVWGEAVKQQGRMEAMEERIIAEIRKSANEAAKRDDHFTAKLETFERESITLPNLLDEHGRTLRDHERRLHKLES